MTEMAIIFSVFTISIWTITEILPKKKTACYLEERKLDSVAIKYFKARKKKIPKWSKGKSLKRLFAVG